MSCPVFIVAFPRAAGDTLAALDNPGQEAVGGLPQIVSMCHKMKFRILSALGALLWLVHPLDLSAQYSISSNNPAVGAPGDLVFIWGAGFSAIQNSPGTLVVKFNNVQADPGSTGVTADNQIQTVVPSGATTGPTRVQINGGVIAVSPQPFTVIGDGPYVTGFTPAAGGPGTTVTLNGYHFSSATGVLFNGVAGNNYNPAQNSVAVDVPAGAMSGPLTVVSSLGTSFNFTTPSNFYVTPAITGFSTNAAAVGSNIVIIGTSFLDASQVLFNGTAAISFAVTNNTNISATIPTNATTGPVDVTTPAGTVESPFLFTVRPLITGITPNFGKPGTNITITGLNLYGVTSLLIGGASATFSNVQYSSVGAVVPLGVTNGPITLVTTNGTTTSGTNLFYVPPVVSSVTPTNGVPGAVVSVSGQDFLGATNVYFNGTPAAGFLVINNTSLSATVPNGVISGPITVADPAGTGTSSAIFYGPPVITSFSPTHGLGGTNVSIIGTNLLGVSGVLFNGVNATVVSVINTGQVNTQVPATATTGPITVIGPAGRTNSAMVFTIDNYADISLLLGAQPSPVFVGSNLVYTIQVANAGPQPAPNVMVTNALPGTVLLTAASTTQGTLTTNGTPILANLGILGAGGSATVTLTVVPVIPGTITDVASVGSTIVDTAPGNNAQTLQTTVLPLAVISVVLSNNVAVVSWPAVLTNFALQSAAILSPATAWSNVVTVPQQVNGQNVVLDPNLGTIKFYRLIEQ